MTHYSKVYISSIGIRTLSVTEWIPLESCIVYSRRAGENDYADPSILEIPADGNIYRFRVLSFADEDGKRIDPDDIDWGGPWPEEEDEDDPA